MAGFDSTFPVRCSKCQYGYMCSFVQQAWAVTRGGWDSSRVAASEMATSNEHEPHTKLASSGQQTSGAGGSRSVPVRLAGE